MTRRITFSLAILLFPFFFSCSGNKDTAEAKGNDKEENEETVEQEERKDSEAQEANVIVKDYRDLDGCQYLLLIEGKKENKLHPLNLDPEYFEDGLELKVRYKKKPVATTCMAGETIELLEVKKR